MSKTTSLYKIKTVAEFESGYWYALELKKFATDIGVANSAKLRKDQLEEIIKSYIEFGVLPVKGVTVKKQKLVRKKDKADKLCLTQPIQHYVSNKATKSFIMAEALKIYPDLPKKSGVWYWTNRWREDKLEQQQNITYLDLIKHFVQLSTQKERLPQIPSARFNNFISDFLAANEGNKEEAKTAWEQLKSLNIPKTYAAWKEYGA